MSHSPSPAAAPALPRHATTIGCAVILLAVVLVYANSLGGPFVYDDIPAITENASLRAGWRVGRILVPPGDTTVSGRPILNLSFAANYAISGTNVWSYHLANVLVHALAALVLFGVVRRTLSRLPTAPRRISRTVSLGDIATRDAWFLALAIALPWALHPLATEAVDYVVQRAESLMSLFLLLTLYCFIRGAAAESEDDRSEVPIASAISASSPTTARGAEQTPVNGWFLGAIVACFLGMATKENMAAAPLLVLLYDRMFVSGTLRTAWRRHGRLYLGLGASWILLGALVFSTGGNRGGSVGLGVHASAWGYWLTQPDALLRYALLSIWPFPLVFDYGTFWVTYLGEVWLQVTLVLAAIGGVVRLVVKNRPAGFAGACALGILAPTSLMPGTTQMIVEHRMYLPLAAVLAVALTGLYGLVGRRSFLAVVVAAGALAGITAARNAVYRDDLVLWSDTAAKRPRNAQAYFHLANGSQSRGRMTEAIAYYQKAVDLFPDYVEAQNNLGNALCQLGRYADALPHYERVLKLKPNAVAQNNAANTLNAMGRTEEAVAHYEQALRQNPDYLEAQVNLGGALMQLGRPAEAMAHLERAAALDAQSSRVQALLADALARAGRPQDAIAHYEAAVLKEPRNAEFRAAFANALADAGRVQDALAQFDQAVALRPDSVELHYNYAVTLAGAGRKDEAVAQLQAALRLRPDFGPARNALEQLR